MKKIVTLYITVMMCIFCLSLPVSVIAATNAQIVNAIDLGMSNLASQQTGGGSWSYGGYDQAATGAAVGAFMTQKSLWGSNAAAYQGVVDAGMNYLLNSATVNTVGVRNDSYNPCGSGTCTGVYWDGNGEATYTTGLVASAIGQYAAGHAGDVATTSGPLANMTWTQIAQGITNEFAAGQSTASSGDRRGGWRYFPGTQDSDSSTTQWAVLSMIYDQSLGATTPAFVKSELKYWLAAVQDPNGGAHYQPSGGNYFILDNSDTGSLLVGLKFVGTAKTDPAVQAALAFLNTHWKDLANNDWFGDFGQPYAMLADFKALELTLGLSDNTTITNLLDTSQANWWQDYNEWLVNNQNGNGSWSGYGNWTGMLATAFDLNIVGGTVIPITPTGTPEPATMLLLGLGLMGLAGVRRKFKK